MPGEIASPSPGQKIKAARNKVIEVVPNVRREIQFAIITRCAEIREARFTVIRWRTRRVGCTEFTPTHRPKR